jgi:large conductance mechanosensitive channel
MGSIVKEFKAFALRGNVMDMAVGIVIGAAFGLIVSSLVADVVMPPIGLLIGGVDFSNLALTLKQATPEQTAVTLNYGHFLQTVIDFLVVALAVFMAMKGMNGMRRSKEQAPAAPPAPSKEESLLTEIRDLLKQR